MRALNSLADLGDLAPDLRSVIEICLQRWIESELLYDPENDTPVYLIEPGDTVDQLVKLSSLLAVLADSDGTPPFEWVLNCQCCFEAGLVLSDDGNGFSLVVPKSPGILPALINACTRLATDDVLSE